MHRTRQVLRPRRHRGATGARSGKKAASTSRRSIPRKPSFSHPAAAAERHRHAAHGAHAFQHTIMDALVRYHRMTRRQHALGAGHRPRRHRHPDRRRAPAAGRRPQSRHDLGRKKFVAQVWDWKETSGSTITRQMRRMGDSVAWEHEYFTMDERLSAVVTDTFVSLYERGPDLPRQAAGRTGTRCCAPAVSDLEVENEERRRPMWHILYPFSDGPQPDANGSRCTACTSRRRGPRPCSPTARSRCIPTTSATST